MSKVTKNISKILVCALVLALVFPLVNLVGGSIAQTNGENVKVQDHQFIIEETEPSGKVTNVRVFDWLGLKGNGTVDVQRPTGFSKPPKIQNVKGFNAPQIQGNTIIWKGLKANGTVNVNNVVSQNIVNKDDLTESTLTEKMPLELRYTYYLDGKKVKNLKDIAGKSGHFRLECYMKNLSKKKEMVTYTDSLTGERKTEIAETYLPLVISPMDWYFDNTVFSNVKTDPTGIISYIPTDYQLSYSIPLFPPATAVDDTIWMEADVKNFSMKPLSMTCAFIFPKTNQVDTIPVFQSGLSQLLGGINLLGAGLGQAVKGVGSTGTSQTLLWGMSQISGGLSLMADPATGLPFAANVIQTQFIPGAQQLYAGLGTAQTPNTLLWAMDQMEGGLNQISAGIGSTTTPETLLYGLGTPGDSYLASGKATLIGGLDDIKTACGNPTDSATAGQKSLMGGFNDIKAGIGKPGDSFTAGQATLLGGLDDIYSQVPIMVNALAPVMSPDYSPFPPDLPTLLTNPPTNVYTALKIIDAYRTDPILGPIIITTIINGSGTQLGLLTQLCTGTDPNTTFYLGAKKLQAGVGTPTDIYPPTNTLFGGLNSISAGIGNLTDTFPAQETLFAGVNGISAGIGSTATPNTLLAGIGNPTDSATAGQKTLFGGLNDIKAGIGSVNTNPSLLYGANAVYGGLTQIKGSVSTGSMTNPGLIEGLEQLGSGLNTAVAGLGSTSNPNTLIGGSTQIQSGLQQLAAGLNQAYTGVTGQMAPAVSDSLKQLDLTVGQLAAITQRGEKFDTYLGRVENKGSTSDTRFLLQTAPVQNPIDNNGWIIALVISLLGAAFLVVAGLFAFKKYA
jgi:hypothetical protein